MSTDATLLDRGVSFAKKAIAADNEREYLKAYNLYQQAARHLLVPAAGGGEQCMVVTGGGGNILSLWAQNAAPPKAARPPFRWLPPVLLARSQHSLYTL